MLDINLLRKDPEKIKKEIEKKGYKINIRKILDLDRKKRKLLQQLENIRREKNKQTSLIPRLKEKEKEKIVANLKILKEKEKKLKEKVDLIGKIFLEEILKIPNLPSPSVPIGESEKDNVILREVGKIPRFDFEIKDYLELAERLDLIDVKRAAKVAGTRFGYLKREAVLIEFALISLAFDFLTKLKFVPLLPPVMLKPEMARGTGYFEATDINEAYFIQKDNLFLVGTSEQSILTMHANEIFEEKDLPKRYVAFSTCFRREAGSWGKDTRGIFRVHQFDKVEMFSFCKPEDSEKELILFLGIQEKLMKKLQLPYRVVEVCSGELGFPAAKKFDIETWFPAQKKYRETHSCSNCTDFQARRLNIRYRKKDGRLEFVHTVNGTVFSQRPILAIFENFQQKDGSIKMPKALIPYLPFAEIKR